MIRVGTSGWTYKSWKGTFYPETLNQRKWLEYYSTVFESVELNTTFYHIPKAKITAGWKDRTPDSFVFSAKLARLITHRKKLLDCKEPVEWYFQEMQPLKAKIGVILIQLPPSLSRDEERIKTFIPRLPAGYRFVFEFRNKEWYNDGVFTLLDNNALGFCIHDDQGKETPLVATSDLVYIRFHGYKTRYGGLYPDDVIQQWANRIYKWNSEGKHVYAYFNNDMNGYAVKNAKGIIELLRRQERKAEDKGRQSG
jgi:uncharacterized protein YecE (DUF72 family)